MAEAPRRVGDGRPEPRFPRDALVWDNHACMPLRIGDHRFMEELERYRRAGVDVVSLNVAMDMLPWERTFKVLATFRSWIAAHGDRFVVGGTADDILAAKASGRLTILFDIEGGGAVDDLPALVETYYALGVRWMLVAYNRRNRLGSGCTVDDEGLTDFGRAVIDAMNDAGMVLCCSHTGAQTARAAIDHSRDPVIFSHSNAAAIHPHPRNIDDGLIRACAERGGVVCVNGLGAFLSDGPPTVEALVPHLEHIAELVGPGHVGLGLDHIIDPAEIADFLPAYADWFPGLTLDAGAPACLGPEAIAPLAGLLLRRGWREQDVGALLGGNLLRLARQVWR